MPIPSERDLDRALSPRFLQPLQLIFFTVTSGVVIFIGVVVWLFATRSPSPEVTDANVGLIRLATLLVLVLTAASFPLARMIYDGFFKPDRLKQALERPAFGGPLGGVLGSLRSAEVARLAVLETVAFLGLVICIFGVMTGVLQRHPLYWVNLLPALFFLGFAAFNYPTRDRLEEVLKEKLARI